MMSDDPSSSKQIHEDIKRLLARTPVIEDACSLDLLVFLYRHPRTLLTNEQLATFVGYEMKVVAKSIDTFIDVGLLERTQNPTHAARMYRLVLESPTTGGLEALLELASTRQRRRDILEILLSRTSSRPLDVVQPKGKLRVIA
jgi:DNA-binding MarR family transcriptional regulator